MKTTDQTKKTKITQGAVISYPDKWRITTHRKRLEARALVLQQFENYAYQAGFRISSLSQKQQAEWVIKTAQHCTVRSTGRFADTVAAVNYLADRDTSLVAISLVGMAKELGIADSEMTWDRDTGTIASKELMKRAERGSSRGRKR